MCVRTAPQNPSFCLGGIQFPSFHNASSHFFPKYYPTSWTSSFTSFRPWNPGILGWHHGVLYVPQCSFFRNMARQVSSLYSDWPAPAPFSMWLCRSLCCGPEWGEPARRSEVEKVPWVMSQDCQLSVLPRHSGCSLGRVARSCLAAQYLSSVCVGPTCLQDNFFLMPLLPVIFVPNHLTFSNSFIQRIVPKHLPYELGTQRWWPDRQNPCFISTYKWKRQQTNISSMKKTPGVQKRMHLGFAPLLS